VVKDNVSSIKDPGSMTEIGSMKDAVILAHLIVIVVVVARIIADRHSSKEYHRKLNSVNGEDQLFTN